VLYQYDTRTGSTKQVIVGASSGHVSHHLLADEGGHAYVPRVFMRADGKAFADLVEYDADLKELAATPLPQCVDGGSPDGNHGITGLAYLPDGRIFFTTHRGQLHAIEPKASSPATVTTVGWFHPEGEAYAPSLFRVDGSNLLAGITRRGERFEWVIYDLAKRRSFAYALDTHGLQNVLLYGSVTRDNAGRLYLGGWARAPSGRSEPLLLQVATAP
jgi:hypothetical protein